MTTSPPPLGQAQHDKKGNMTPAWAIWFDGIWKGDAGTTWTPTFTSLTEVGGAATITGRYYRLSRYLMAFTITITPVTNTSATAGTTYCDNFPNDVISDGVCWAVAGNVGGNAGHVVASNDRIYVPGWTTITNPVTIFGICEAN